MQSNKRTIEVQLDIFSGRPNPEWELSKSQLEELKAKVSMPLPRAPEPRTSLQLGYRGFIIKNPGIDPDLPELIHSYSSVLVMINKNEAKYYEDINDVEEWLISQAREYGYGEAIDESRKLQANL